MDQRNVQPVILMARISYAVRIRQRIAAIEGEVAALQAELNELKVAYRVIGRMGSDEGEEDADTPRASKAMTVADMIAEVLSNGAAIDSQEILDRVSSFHQTTFNTISTTLSRMKASGRVSLNGRLWSLTETNEAPQGGNPESASEPEEPPKGFL